MRGEGVRPLPPPRVERGDALPKLGLFSSGWVNGDSVQFGASDFWRVAVPARELSRQGWDVAAGRQLRSADDGTIIVVDEHGGVHDDCDVLLLQRWMGEGMPEAILRARAAGQFVVSDLDDQFWAIPRGHTARDFTDPKFNPTYNREIYRKVLAASSLVTVATPYLARLVERWGPPVRLIRNYVPLDLWRSRPPGRLIGWVGAIPWRGADLQLLTPTVIPWLRERGLPFYHGGHMNAQPRSASQILGYDRVTVRPATDLPSYPRLWDPLGVALIPIENSSFGAAKSWCKGLEA